MGFLRLSANSYPSQNETIRTAGSANVLIAREDVPDSVVYALTKLIWENLAEASRKSAEQQDQWFLSKL